MSVIPIDSSIWWRFLLSNAVLTTVVACLLILCGLLNNDCPSLSSGMVDVDDFFFFFFDGSKAVTRFRERDGRRKWFLGLHY